MSKGGRHRRELARQKRRRVERERKLEMRQQPPLPLPISKRQRIADFFREFKWIIVKSLPLGVILPITIFFGSVGPDDFAKNYAGWARKFGLANQADWLSLHATGPRVFWGVVLVSIVYLLIAFIIPSLIRRAQKDRAAIAVPMLVGLIVVVALYGQNQLLFASSDRHLNEYQRAKLKDDLAPLASNFPRAIAVMAAEANPEASGYAVEIMIALAQAGLKVASSNQRFPQPFRMTAGDPSVRGVFFQVHDSRNIPKEVQLLRNALQDADISTVLYNNPDLLEADYAFTVGLK